MKMLLMLWLLLPCLVQAQWRLESSTDAAPLGHGATFVIKTVSGPAKAELKIVLFDEKECHIRVVANPDRKAARPLDDIARVEKALAVCNGGYFNAGGDLGPSGLEIAKGIRTSRFQGDRGWVGALMVRQGKASLILENEFQDKPDITDFVQCSPWLVNHRQISDVLLQGQDVRNHRTFIMTDGEGRWAMGVCNSVGLLELAQILLTPGIITEIKVQRALNLDGGPSTGLWCRSAGGREHFEKPGWAVRNAIVIVPRDAR